MDIIELVDKIRNGAELAAHWRHSGSFHIILEWVECELAVLAKVEHLTEA